MVSPAKYSGTELSATVLIVSVLSLFDVVVIRVFEGLPGSASRAL